MAQQRILRQLVSAGLPVGDLADAAARVLVQRNVEALDQLRIAILDEVRRVLGVVLAGLGDVVAEAAHQLQAHHVAVQALRLIQLIRLGQLLPAAIVDLLAAGQHGDALLQRADIQLALVVQERAALDLRIQIHAVLRAFQQPRLMVDAGDLPLHGLVIAHAQLVE